jgi:DHA1 family bicyclomycin/chloramphenicol resistance-like MFS transporter
VNHRIIALILAGLSGLGPFSVDTYFPSFPAIANHFGVSHLAMQSTLTFYLVALAVMNLFHGALSDSFGRRRVIMSALAVYAASGVACVIAPSFTWLLALRVVQGLSAGAGMIVSRAVIRDRYQGHEAQKFMAEVTMVGGLAPAAAPILGGWLHVWFGWRGPFYFLGLLGVALFFACHFGLPETLRAEKRQPFHPGKLSRSYWTALRHPAFVALCLSMAFGGGGFLIYVATAPDVVLNILKLRETQFAWLFVPIVTGLISGAALSARLAGRMAPAPTVRLGFGLMSAGALLNMIVCTVLPLRVPWAVLPLTVYTFGFSVLAPVITIQSLDLFPDRRGLASSLQGFAHVVVFALVSGLGARLVYNSGPRHAAAMAFLTALSWLAYKFGYARALRLHSSPRT